VPFPLHARRGALGCQQCRNYPGEERDIVPMRTRDQWGHFYRQHLETAILPFWLAHSIDDEYGGFFTCFDNSGDRLVSTDKYAPDGQIPRHCSMRQRTR